MVLGLPQRLGRPLPDMRTAFFAVLACAGPGALVAQSAAGATTADSVAIVAIIDRLTATARRAWETRDARLMIPDTAAGAAVRNPQGQMVSSADLRADLRRRMDLTTRVDTMIERLDSVRMVHRDTALAYSSQRFVRLVRMPDGAQRRRFSTVAHERTMVRRSNRWADSGPVREIAPRAWWEGETPP